MIRAFLLLAILGLAPACERTSKPAPQPQTAEPSNQTSGKVSAAADAKESDLAALPQLKPIISVPFPEGVSEEQVCEAIADTDETDLWLRFGHFLPMYRLGAVYVIDGNEKDVKTIEDLVWNDYIPGLFRPDIRECPGKGLLLYLADMQEKGDSYGRPFGREHFAAELKKRGISVRESFSASLRQRLREYCESSATVCDKLLQLAASNRGLGLCIHAPRVCSKSIDKNTVSKEVVLERCMKTDRDLMTCMETSTTGGEFQSCKTRIRSQLCNRD